MSSTAIERPAEPLFEHDPVIMALMTQLPVGVIMAARDGSFEYVNDLAGALFDEHQRAHAAKEPWIAHSEYRYLGLEPIQWIIARVLLTGEIVRGEQFEYINAHNEWRCLNVSATPIDDRRGAITHALITFMDVTELNRAREWEPLIRAITRL